MSSCKQKGLSRSLNCKRLGSIIDHLQQLAPALVERLHCAEHDHIKSHALHIKSHALHIKSHALHIKSHAPRLLQGV